MEAKAMVLLEPRPCLSPAAVGQEVRAGARTRAELALVVLLGLGAALLYTLFFQRWLFGDGPQLVDTFLFKGGYWMHILYLPAAYLLRDGLQPEDPIDSLRWLSIFGGALGVSGVFVLARSFGLTRARALFSALLAATTPAIWFFSTTIELHALHFATVTACACLVSRVSWSRPRLAGLLTLASVPLLFWTHKSALLLAPGWLFLALHVRERSTGRAPDARIVDKIR